MSPTSIQIDGFVRILNVDADTPNTSCRPPGAVETEVTVGAHGDGHLRHLPDRRAPRGQVLIRRDGGVLTGLDGLLDLQSKLQIRQVTLDRVALKFGFGSGEAYITGRVGGKIDFVASEVFSFFGRTRNPETFELIDRDTRALLAKPGLDADGCFTTPLLGFYVGSEATLSINEFFRIPDTCLLRLHGIYGSAGLRLFPGGRRHRRRALPLRDRGRGAVPRDRARRGRGRAQRPHPDPGRSSISTCSISREFEI